MDKDHLPYQVLDQVTSRRFKLTKNIKTSPKDHTYSSFMAETTKLLILPLGTFPGNLSSKELKV